MISREELLEAVNHINAIDGGRMVGTVGEFHLCDGEFETGASYTGQYLVRVAYEDNEIQLGFCQSSISRAPAGGYPLSIPAEILELCETVDDVLDVWDAMKGNANERMEEVSSWHTS